MMIEKNITHGNVIAEQKYQGRIERLEEMMMHESLKDRNKNKHLKNNQNNFTYGAFTWQDVTLIFVLTLSFIVYILISMLG